jgi:hypothetical protein
MVRLRDGRREIWPQTDERSVAGEGELVRVRREVVGHGVLDDLEQLFGAVDTPDGELVKELDCCDSFRKRRKVT